MKSTQRQIYEWKLFIDQTIKKRSAKTCRKQHLKNVEKKLIRDWQFLNLIEKKIQK